MKKKFYLEKILNVVEMNKLFREIKTEEQRRELADKQTVFVLEELKETLEKGLAKNDIKEFIDGVSDVFVTATFFDVLLFADEESYIWHFLNHDFKPSKNTVPVLLNKIKNQLTLRNPFEITKLVFDLINKIDSISGEKYDLLRQKHRWKEVSLMSKAIQEVEISNLSKFPKVSEKTEKDIEKDIIFIKKNKGLSNVGHVVNNGRIIYLDLDAQKFQKPTTFKEPKLDFVKEASFNLFLLN